MKQTFIITLICLIFLGCSMNQSGVSYSTTTVLEKQPTETISLNDGDSFHMTLEKIKTTIQGKEVEMFAYNQQIPGPIIRVPQGSEITLYLKNNIGEDTTLHSHGLRLDNAFDGVPDMQQQPIKNGNEFVYTLKFPDVGIYWYHPHIREDKQQELGLYGNFYVIPKDENYWNPVNKEEFIFLDDIKMDNNGIAPFSDDFTDHSLMGRFGNVFLTNGKTEYTLNINQGDIVRFYITNAANTRTFNLSIPGLKLKKVGSDNGKYETEEWVNSLIIAPSERYIFEAYFPNSTQYMLHHETPQGMYMLGNIIVASESSDNDLSSTFDVLHENQNITTEFDKFKTYFDAPVDKSLTLSLIMKGMKNSMNMSMGKSISNDMGEMDHSMHTMSNTDEAVPKIEWEDTMGMMNEHSNSEMIEWQIIDDETGNMNDAIHWKFKKGDLVKIKIFNDPSSMHPMQHPIHFHGQRFLVLTTNGNKNENLTWKDTTLIQTGDTVEILVEMSNPGEWLAHCHIAEHMHSGMMFPFKVLDE